MWKEKFDGMMERIMSAELAKSNMPMNKAVELLRLNIKRRVAAGCTVNLTHRRRMWVCAVAITNIEATG